MNRVDQVYEDDLSIRLGAGRQQRPAQPRHLGAATGPNGPCGTAACFTRRRSPAARARRRPVRHRPDHRRVNYDIGHLASAAGRRRRQPRLVGRSNKAGGCTGIPTPVGDFYAVDYVAHEMGHQFAATTRSTASSPTARGQPQRRPKVEPGSGSSVMAYAGICVTEDLQPHSDPYFSERSQQEITTYTYLRIRLRLMKCRPHHCATSAAATRFRL